jgi:hypothetical protein
MNPWNLDLPGFPADLTGINFPKNVFYSKMCLLRLDMHFKHTCYILKNIFHIPFSSGYDSGMYRNFIHHTGSF